MPTRRKQTGRGSAPASDPSPLRMALQRYVDARHASIIEARRALGINELDARAILFIAANPGTRPSALRDYLGITSAGVTALIDRLSDRDVVRRSVDPHDRRVNRLALTIDLFTEPWSALTRFDAAFEAALADAEDTDSAHLAAALDALTAAASDR